MFAELVCDSLVEMCSQDPEAFGMIKQQCILDPKEERGSVWRGQAHGRLHDGGVVGVCWRY